MKSRGPPSQNAPTRRPKSKVIVMSQSIPMSNHSITDRVCCLGCLLGSASHAVVALELSEKDGLNDGWLETIIL